MVYDVSSLGECPASGSFKMDAMIIVPCSMKTAAGIASGYSDNLLLRAADVTLKEARQLVLVARESPLSPVHLRNLHELSSMGVRVVPPMISFYQKYTTIEAWTDNLRNGCWKYWDYIIQCNPGAECRETHQDRWCKLINLIEKQIVLLDRIVQVSVCRTECGIQVLIAGGDRSHIGAVSIVDENLI